VGGKNEIKSDFRLVAATNRHLDAMEKSGQFRRDLLYRIKSLKIQLPPLRERPEDISDIALFHIKKICERNQIGTKGTSSEFVEILKRYKWPGNVRELINTLEFSISANLNHFTLLPIHLPKEIRIESARALVGNNEEESIHSKKNIDPALSPPTFRESIQSAEKKYIMDLMSITNGDIKLSCEISGLSRSRLYGILKKYGLSRKS
jgi:two-component system NtrC family response regulator